MKKFNYFFALLFLVAAIISCDKRDVEMRELPVSSEGGAVAIVNIGNTSCEDVAIDKNMTFAFSSGKADYVNGEFVFESPSTGWPEGLNVTVTDGKYVQFTYSSNQYCVGAVIVKGGNASNVFTYNPGVESDAGLASPVNSSGGPAGLSNLTFCFVECQKVVSKDAYAIKDHVFYAKCFSEISLPGYIPSRLGWTNGRLWVREFNFNLFADGTDCTNFGTLVGSMTVNYNGSQATVNISMISPYTLDAIHAYIGKEMLPMIGGLYTDDPLLYPFQADLDNAENYSFTIDGLSGDIYVLIHATVYGF